jgi:endonuclease G
MLESQVREWAKTNKSVHVVTGPALEQGILEKIGPNKVSVPSYYYKVIWDDQEPELKGIGFIMPNQTLSGSIEDYAVTIDSVEVFTGIDFYSTLSDPLEDSLEANINLSAWGFGKDSEYREEENTRCLTITEDGTRCERTTTNESGYCWQHE